MSIPATTSHPLVFFGVTVTYHRTRAMWTAALHAEAYQGTPYGPVTVGAAFRAVYIEPPEGQPHGGARMALDALLAQATRHGLVYGTTGSGALVLTYRPEDEEDSSQQEDIVRREAARLGWEYVPDGEAWPVV